jgi:hypothetical protein
MLGDPILNDFEIGQSQIDAMIKNGQAKAGIDGLWTSIFEMEIQFRLKDAIDPKSFMTQLKIALASEWLNGTLWIEVGCLSGFCTTKSTFWLKRALHMF